MFGLSWRLKELRDKEINLEASEYGIRVVLHSGGFHGGPAAAIRPDKRASETSNSPDCYLQESRPINWAQLLVLADRIDQSTVMDPFDPYTHPSTQ